MADSDAAVSDLSHLELEVFHDLRAPYRIEPHAHPHFELLYIARGARDAEIDGQRYRAAAGQLLIFEPGVVHSEADASPRLSLFVLRFKTQSTHAALSLPSTARSGPVVTVPSGEHLVDVLTRLLDERRATRLGRDAMLSAYWTELAVLLRRTVSQANRVADTSEAHHVRRLQRAARVLAERPADPPSLQELADSALMSPSHFASLFKRTFGCGPRDYAIQARIARGQVMLQTTGLSARDIALELGYRDPFFFYRQFKQRTGRSPGQYRSEVGGKTLARASATGKK